MADEITGGGPAKQMGADGQLTPEQTARKEEIKANIHWTDMQALLQYGVGVQRKIAGCLETILAQMQNSDSVHAGDLMQELAQKIKDTAADQPEEGIFDRILFFKKGRRMRQKMARRYEILEVQMDRMEQELEQVRMRILKDIILLDGLYEKNMESYQDLQVYIAAGEEKLDELQNHTLQNLRGEAADQRNPMKAQAVRELEDVGNRLEQKLHDLKLSRAIALQAALQIRMIQNHDKMLADKIQMEVLGTIPLWKGRIAMALGLHRQAEAAGESKQGTVDLETLNKGNAEFIAVMEEAIAIQKKNHAAHQKAEQELAGMEQKFEKPLPTFSKQ